MRWNQLAVVAVIVLFSLGGSFTCSGNFDDDDPDPEENAPIIQVREA